MNTKTVKDNGWSNRVSSLMTRLNMGAELPVDTHPLDKIAAEMLGETIEKLELLPRRQPRWVSL